MDQHTVIINVGRLLFTFASERDWITNANREFRRHGFGGQTATYETICIDKKGRVCTLGKHFSRAEADGAYPIRVFAITLPNSTPTPAALPRFD